MVPNLAAGSVGAESRQKEGFSGRELPETLFAGEFRSRESSRRGTSTRVTLGRSVDATPVHHWLARGDPRTASAVSALGPP